MSAQPRWSAAWATLQPRDRREVLAVLRSGRVPADQRRAFLVSGAARRQRRLLTTSIAAGALVAVVIALLVDAFVGEDLIDPVSYGLAFAVGGTAYQFGFVRQRLVTVEAEARSRLPRRGPRAPEGADPPAPLPRWQQLAVILGGLVAVVLVLTVGAGLR